MSLPVDPTLDCSAATYSLESGKRRAPLTNSQAHGNMYSPRTPRQEQQQRTTDSPPPPKGRLERFRDYIGRTCCSCFLKVLRNNHLFPKPDPLDGDEDDVVDELRRDGIRVVHGIPSTALFPPNVSLCEGFGFACTNQPSMVISTALRCDGKADCPDGSDELNCKECQSAFSCSISPKSKVKVCLRAEQLCDGIAHCPDGYDEEKHCKSTCDDDEMSCPSTSLCLPSSSVCDGIVDCDTEEDEVNCEECTRGAQFCEVTKRCIPAGQLCDGIPQCPDRSDEKGCDCRACSGSGKALCADGECLERSRVCDGIVDCSDGIDEKDCPGSCLLEQDEQIPYVKCADGRRYPEAEACSGVIEQCAYNCTKCDPQLAFTCNDKKCVPQMLVCDGIDDCSEGEDERSCSCGGPDKFECRSASGKTKCIAKKKVCDGVWDCMDGKDETNCDSCPRDSIRCPGEGKCIPMISRCDGVVDCRDGSDETDCTCQGRYSASQSFWQCRKLPMWHSAPYHLRDAVDQLGCSC
ncbi:Low-density lipoprotein receptor domain class A [Ancylostoma caninum]|uniref:Low-density lipoprotein receptor domain class A n=1 Tax=Ancylostoma caninum TaxID=29170 RepID=A0A368FJ02_ANCCA|nr:Low-density lipoprotein receptor domain class A [Ancylostoma caninum]